MYIIRKIDSPPTSKAWKHLTSWSRAVLELLITYRGLSLSVELCSLPHGRHGCQGHLRAAMGSMRRCHIISGWWYTYPSEKYESLGMIIPNIWKNKNVLNHQPDIHLPPATKRTRPSAKMPGQKTAPAAQAERLKPALLTVVRRAMSCYRHIWAVSNDLSTARMPKWFEKDCWVKWVCFGHCAPTCSCHNCTTVLSRAYKAIGAGSLFNDKDHLIQLQ